MIITNFVDCHSGKRPAELNKGAHPESENDPGVALLPRMTSLTSKRFLNSNNTTLHEGQGKEIRIVLYIIF